MGPDHTFPSFRELGNDIHLLFAKANFGNHKNTLTPESLNCIQQRKSPSGAAYLALTPALRLASLLFIARSMLAPFNHGASGIVTADADGDEYFAPGPMERTDIGLAYVDAIFLHMARSGV